MTIDSGWEREADVITTFQYLWPEEADKYLWYMISERRLALLWSSIKYYIYRRKSMPAERRNEGNREKMSSFRNLRNVKSYRKYLELKYYNRRRKRNWKSIAKKKWLSTYGWRMKTNAVQSWNRNINCEENGSGKYRKPMTYTLYIWNMAQLQHNLTESETKKACAEEKQAIEKRLKRASKTKKA